MVSWSAVHADSAPDPRAKLAELDSVLERRDTHYMNHSLKIDSVKEIVRLNPLATPLEKGRLYHDIFNLYSAFQGDSAYTYASRELEEVKNQNNPNAFMIAMNDLLQAYVSRGQWTRASAILKQVQSENRLNGVADEIKGEHFFLCNRLYTDMSNWNDCHFTDDNATVSFAYCDSVIKYMPRGRFETDYAQVSKTLPALNTDQKIETLHRLLDQSNLTMSNKAMISSVVGDLYYQKGDHDRTLFYKAQSAILDILSSKRETTSKGFLAQMMFEENDIDRASRYIHAALEDAEFFNAPQRKAEISNILPLIEQTRYMNLTRRNTALWWVLGVVVLAMIGISILTWKINQQRNQLSKSNAIISRQNHELDESRKLNDEQNARLRSTLEKYRESVKIKDEYIGYGFWLNSQYIVKMERLYKMINRKLAARQYDDLKMSLKEQDLRKEKDEMRKEFDKTFLNLFPAFVEQYNSLFPENEGVVPPDANSLTPEMRIFALIRLGINDISSIATFLNYSVNTVNTYKTKAKNRSTVANELFEAEVMNIRSAE